MMNHPLEAWELFLQTGRISDYMRYRQMAGPVEDELIEGEEDRDAGEYTSHRDWRS